jgi:hypothetical protein
MDLAEDKSKSNKSVAIATVKSKKRNDGAGVAVPSLPSRLHHYGYTGASLEAMLLALLYLLQQTHDSGGGTGAGTGTGAVEALRVRRERHAAMQAHVRADGTRGMVEAILRDATSASSSSSGGGVGGDGGSPIVQELKQAARRHWGKLKV